MTRRSSIDPHNANRPPDRTRRRLVGGSALAAAATLPVPWLAGAARAAQSPQAVIDAAVAAGDVPFAVAMIGTSGGVRWSGAAGEARPGVAASTTTMFRIFSQTKAVGSTAAMMMVDRGRFSLDTPVEDVLPEFARLRVLEGFDGDKPILRAPKVRATVRHLATHTSGLTYEFWNADIGRYLAVTKHPSVISGLRAALDYPLAFDPGTRWDYGMGIDWLGLMVEKVDGRRIDRFCTEEIFEPLGMVDTVFELDEGRMARLADLKARGEDGRFAPFELAPPANPEVYGMGHCLYATPADYMRFLRMFLNKGQLEGRRVLSEGAVSTMLENHVGDIRVPKMITQAPPVSADVDLFPQTPKTHSVGFLRVEDDVPGMRTKGSQGWAGVCNTHYWFDPQRDIAGIIMTQSLPFVEPRFLKTYEAFERAAYAA